jgi:hypothetical protein
MSSKPHVVQIDPSDKVFKTDGCQPRQKTRSVLTTALPASFLHRSPKPNCTPALTVSTPLPASWLDNCRGPGWSAVGFAVLKSVRRWEGGFSIVMATACPISENNDPTRPPLLEANRHYQRVSAAGTRNQLTGSWHDRHTVDPYRCRNSDRAWNHKVLNEAMKVPLRVVPDRGAQPRRAPPHQIGSQGDSFHANQFQKLANCCERFTSTDCHKDGVTLNRAQVRLSGLSEGPGAVGFLHESHHDHHRSHFAGPRLKPGLP